MKSEKIQSYLAVFLAIFAVVISIWQGYEQRRHNRLSVKPILTFDGITSNNRRMIRLSNDGLGPAIIKRFRIIEDGKIYDAADGNPWNKLSFFSSLNYSEMYYFDDGATIKPEDTYHLLSWEIDTTHLLGIELWIEYESIYEERFELRDDF